MTKQIITQQKLKPKLIEKKLKTIFPKIKSGSNLSNFSLKLALANVRFVLLSSIEQNYSPIWEKYLVHALQDKNLPHIQILHILYQS